MTGIVPIEIETPVPPAQTTTAPRLSLVALAVGVPFVALVASTYRPFDLDRFFVPKELVLHLVALTAAMPILIRAPRLALSRVDLALGATLLLSLLSAVFSTNPWLAQRALAITISSLMLYWSSRAVASAGAARVVVGAVAVAGVIAATTSLLQAYGVTSDFFSINRAPGGTMGNRNFVAHLAAITLPALFAASLAARRSWLVLLSVAGVAVLADALVLSRSRGAWLALAGSGTVFALVAWRAIGRWPDSTRARRLVWLLLGAIAGAVAAVTVPNTLEWRSRSPYLESVTGVVNYREGSGRGRLVQYENSLRLAASHPLLGVGPGNWPVAYPRVASRDDPSLTDDGTTANPWPSSDWVAFAAERGPVAALLLGGSLLALLFGAVGAMRRASTADEFLRSGALVATLIAAGIAGTFDAVLLLAASAAVTWCALGALSSPAEPRFVMGHTARQLVLGAAIIVGGLDVLRSGAQLGAIGLASTSESIAQLERAASLDPGSARLQLRLAERWLDRGSCKRAVPHARRAHALLPAAPAARHVLGACGVRVR